MHSLLVDGYNMMHALPEFRRLLDKAPAKSALADARAALARSLGRLAAAKKGNIEIHLFFDSKEPRDFFDAEPLVPGVEVHFPYSGETADEAILDYLRQFENKALFTVVTDDRSLARQAGDEGAEILSSAGLARRLMKI